ncbi:T-cell activation inhibitor, mitochondrial [Latimeria chalumnae]|uniref:T cell activation inhibitor, mitochondrial n=1 Tax=Latimeria chalumnae TaxID=7897 RepID=H3AK42_LATCH|nr:PREDICTED: T-cell activation inhibitor, mitochondrial [Latimeria chalumnae]XP_006000633.1 PREDICTED: T-cell activation inhibitor, mitochondrial [Latimeria chalumnae]XP_006000634.1 PREDICTED: T-cell activation inhibitor, mitochondrial [Latimeria chalumnae]XP_006000635.1 PREDICTED: T-cell activation inhibitor, mitochondrial [Latimeria chalumnae]XP_006000636.1 PREDICTED: T-cell activation inhibitor, mitochondrial [Latimeria chalumnae]|eukprot:XP_006000632.1 PREDICTED: T-cell activation inhibitor, mitochondrial [Latimeria chalumnae]
MIRHLQYVTRCCLEKAFTPHVLQTRALSGADAANALRPFYFAVHPDFFGQYPRERDVNENSLKRLNSYLETLQKPGVRSLKPTQLTFYVRDTDKDPAQEPINASGFRAVSFTLQTRDLLTTVLDVLQSCSLSTEHVQNFKDPVVSNHQHPGSSGSFYRPIKWNKTYYSFTGFRDPEEELEQARRVDPTLTSWLDNNEASATKKLKDSLPRREELTRLKTELCEQLKLNNIRWQRSWGIAHRCSQLHSLSRLSHQNPEALKNVKGRTLIFTDRTGMNAVGHVMLGTVDVHHHWTKLFERLPSHYILQRHLSLLEDRISHLLGGIQIIYLEELQPSLTLEESYSSLHTFYKRLFNSRLPFHPRSLRGLKMILDTGFCTPSLHELGHFNIPSACDLASLQWFILTKAQEARKKLKRIEDLEVKERELLQACTEKHSLRMLYKESSVSSAQMVSCCKRLLEEPFPSLQGMHLCISHFYSVLQDGDLCIPWDWKS